jgi:hypothetical protein
MLTQELQCSITWVNTNFMTSTLVAGFTKDKKHLKCDKEIYKEITREFDEFFITWSKLLIPYFVFLGDNAQNFILLLFISFITLRMIHSLSKDLVYHLKSCILDEEKYNFY